MLISWGRLLYAVSQVKIYIKGKKPSRVSGLERGEGGAASHRLGGKTSARACEQTLERNERKSVDTWSGNIPG